ncbi:MAG TPA: nitroreductase [Streptosporangiaceae bacterium]|nr:nitroreductase [Streptosporangiaceae bacterium]
MKAEHDTGPATFDFLSVITSRHCKRAFLDEPVSRADLERVLTAAAHAPSPRNTQFWQVAVLMGEARAELSRRLCAALDSPEQYEHDYTNRPSPMGATYEQRAFAWGAEFYGAMGVNREDRAARREFERRNLCFYGAPVAMIFHLPHNAVAGTFLEMGFFLQNVMLGLVSAGLGSCPQYSVARYADVIRDVLGLGADRLVVCSLSVGHVDESAAINRFHPQRAALSEYTQWHDQVPSETPSRVPPTGSSAGDGTPAPAADNA